MLELLAERLLGRKSSSSSPWTNIPLTDLTIDRINRGKQQLSNSLSEAVYPLAVLTGTMPLLLGSFIFFFLRPT